MAIERYIEEPAVTSFSSDKEGASQGKQKSILAPVGGSENTHSGGFECNICLDSVQDPVVTFCGHLYCWPCIYKWIHLQSVSSENTDQQQPQCPVCKAEVSQKALVPLYGRGQTTNLSEGKACHLGIVIPQRPSSLRCGSRNLVTATIAAGSYPTQQQHHNSYPQQLHPQHHYVGSYAATPMLNLAGSTTTNVFNSSMGMFGEMVYARIFGNSQTTLYAYPNSYNLAESSSPRVRRLLVETDKSLSRICFFLCCCTILCLLLF